MLKHYRVKIDLDHALAQNNPVILELGCGPNKKQGRIGIDVLDFPEVDIVADLNSGLSFLPNDSVDEIHSSHFLEHIDNLELLIKEIVRVLKPSGRNILQVPHFSNPYYYSDYTHKKFMGLYTFYYFVDTEYQLRRKVPNFYTNTRIRIIKQKLIFRSEFRGLKMLKKQFQKLVNISSWMQEFYEGNLCYIIPCDTISIVFEPVKNNREKTK